MVSRRTILIGGGAAAGAAGLGWAALGGADYDGVAAEVWSPRDPAEADYLVHYATRAANSHNTQPWRFAVAPDAVTIRPDLSRATPVADPDNHHLWASLGCAAENLVLAAGAAGRPAEATLETGSVSVRLGRGDAARDPLFEAILARQCTRSDYDGQPVPSDDLARLSAAASVPGVETILITDRARMDAVAELILEGNTAQVENPAFRDELKSWLRFSAARAIETRDGLYSACSGNPTMPDWIGQRVFGMVFKADSENARIGRQLASSSGIAVFVSDRDDTAHWVAAGRAYQRFALEATALGIRHAFLNQAVEVPEVRPELQSLLGLGGRRPDLVVRFGYAPQMPRSLRRPVADVIDAARA